MGKKNRRSREEILARRERTRQESTRRAVGLTLTGGLSLDQFPEDVQELVAELEDFDRRLEARGWAYDDDFPTPESLAWSRPLQPDGREVSLSVGTLDDDFAPRAREDWKIQVALFEPSADSEAPWLNLSFQAFWDQVETLEAGVLNVAES